MPKKNTLRKLGIFKSGSTAKTHTNAKKRPTEIQMGAAFDTERDLIKHSKSEKNKTEKPKAVRLRWNTLSIIGFILAFLVPLAGFICSIIALFQIKKSNESGKSLAIAGALIATMYGIVQFVLAVAVIFIIVTVASSSSLVEYKNTDLGYSVQHPRGWQVSESNDGNAQIVTIKKEHKETGKVYGMLEVTYIPPPVNGYKKDILDTIGAENKNESTVIVSELRKQTAGGDILTLVTTHNSKDGQIKAKTTIFKEKNNAVYMVSTQAPLEKWMKYKDDFSKIHSTFIVD